MNIQEGIDAILAGNAFANAFWVFVGIVSGTFIQLFFNWSVNRAQRRNAMTALGAEIEMNLAEVKSFQDRLQYLRDRIAAGQIKDVDLFVSMQGFDYSIVNPLIASGHFHIALGSRRVRQYFDFMRFFNNNSVEAINSTLKTEHARSKSLDYIAWLEAHSKRLADALCEIPLR